MLRQAGIGICLVYDLGYQLLLAVEGIRILGSWDLGARDCVAGAVDNQQSEKSPYAVDEICDYCEVDEKEDQDAFPHGCESRKGIVVRESEDGERVLR